MTWILWLLLALQSRERFVHEQPGFEVVLPTSEWKQREVPTGGDLTVVLAPTVEFTTRCSILRQPKSFLPQGLLTREEQIRGSAGQLYARVSLGPGTIAGRESVRWEYTIAGATVVEWAFEEGRDLVIFQLAAPAEVWIDEAQRAALESMRDSFVWRGGAAAVATRFDATPPDQIRARRSAALGAKEPPVDLFRHTIEARIEPRAHSIDVLDTVELEARQEGVKSLTLYTSVVTVDDVTCDLPMEWRVEKQPQADLLVIDFEEPLTVGEEVALLVHAACSDFLLEIDQKLVAEIAIVGQIRERSSFSSHVFWYPMAEVNDAEVDITFTVPAPYVALTGGTLLGTTESATQRTFHYAEKVRIHRLLPFAFAVGEYLSRSGKSAAGLELSAWGFAGDEKRLEQRVVELKRAAASFEQAFGPLPWTDVRFIHVQPERKETGVSLPGMIVVSDGYFPDLEGVDLSDGDLTRRSSLGLLVIADELSHQWNIYASGFPNELGEGISTFTNALFVEARHGNAAYRKTIAGCRDGWLLSAGRETEFAVANPAVYSNTRYRAVVFCKTPLALDALRRQLGDEKFFAGLRRAFELKDPAIDGFERLERGFTEVAGSSLRPFFDQWFFRAGFPTLSLSHVKTATGVRVVVRQTQEEAPYTQTENLRVECEDGSRHDFPVELHEKEQTFEWPLPSPAKSVDFDPPASGRVTDK